MIEKKLKYMTLRYLPEERKLHLSGGSKYVSGEISINYRYLYSVFCFIARIFRRKKK